MLPVVSVRNQPFVLRFWVCTLKLFTNNVWGTPYVSALRMNRSNARGFLRVGWWAAVAAITILVVASWLASYIFGDSKPVESAHGPAPDLEGLSTVELRLPAQESAISLELIATVSTNVRPGGRSAWRVYVNGEPGKCGGGASGETAVAAPNSLDHGGMLTCRIGIQPHTPYVFRLESQSEKTDGATVSLRARIPATSK